MLGALGAAANEGAPRSLRVDAGQVIGIIRSFQGVNSGPAPLLSRLTDVAKEYRALRIDLVRTHDFFGPTDLDAQWPNPDTISKSVRASGENSIFRDWNNDPNDEHSYHFEPSDKIIQAIVGCGASVYYRIGRSWGADPAPPPDFDKYANVVKHVAMHYNAGWANGFKDQIRYWEFWNEPDLDKNWNPEHTRAFWSGSPEQFYALYEKVARALKAHDPNLKIGAPGTAVGSAPGPYREGLMDYCAAHQVPLDFFSWHHYAGGSADPYDLVRIAKAVRALLDQRGLRQTEVHVTEWSNTFGTSPLSKAWPIVAAFIASAQIYLQDSPMDRSLYYRGDASSLGLFEYNGNYRKTAYVFKALGALRDTAERLAVSGGNNFGFVGLAGRSDDGKTVQVLVSNYEIPAAYRQGAVRSHFTTLQRRKGIQYPPDNRSFSLEVANFPWGNGKFTVKRYRITETDDWTESESSGSGGVAQITSSLPPPGVEFVVIRSAREAK